MTDRHRQDATAGIKSVETFGMSSARYVNIIKVTLIK
jgi:hypothetical protein